MDRWQYLGMQELRQELEQEQQDQRDVRAGPLLQVSALRDRFPTTSGHLRPKYALWQVDGGAHQRIVMQVRSGVNGHDRGNRASLKPTAPPPSPSAARRAAAARASGRPSRALHLQPPGMQQRLGVAAGLGQALEHQVAGGLEGG